MSGRRVSILDAPDAWDVTQGSRRIVIATMDTGVMQTHRDLAANLWTAPRAFTVMIGGMPLTCAAGSHGFNAVSRNCDPADDNGHGTHVAGSIGAVGNNTNGVVGINWVTSIMALKFMDASGNGYISDAINAIEFALQVRQTFASTGEADIRVLNNSWSGGGFSKALSDEIEKAAGAGMLFVASAGNTALNHEVTPAYPSDYAGSNVLSVAATDYRDRLGSFSDFGPQHVHIGAPGVLIYSTTLSATDPGGSYGTLTGTSMAAAYTSGVAALVLSHCDYDVGALRDALVRTGVPVPALRGRTQYRTRLNAAAAVRSCDTASAGSDIVIHAADIPAADRHGAWEPQADSTAADGTALGTVDSGWSSTSAPLAQPSDYFDVRFPAQAGRSYRVWLRLKAEADSKWNDSVWLQFSDARVNGEPAYGINSTEGLAIDLETARTVASQDGGGRTAPTGWHERPSPSHVWHTDDARADSGRRRRDRSDRGQCVGVGVGFPGQVGGDSTIVARTPPSSPPGFSETPGAPVIRARPKRCGIPGTVQVEDFDNGGEGVAYHDTD